MMRGKILMGLLLLSLLIPVASGMDYEDYSYEEEDGENDVCYFRLFPIGIYIGKQYPDLDISYAGAEYYNGTIEFTLKVYGEIRVDGSYKYYFDIDTSHESDLGYDIVLAFQDGMTTLEYQNNWTTLDITEWTDVNRDTLKMGVPIEYFEGLEIIELQIWALITDFNGGRSYMDSTEPIEEDAKKDPTIVICITVPTFLICLTLLIVYLVYRKKMKRFVWGFTKKKCPNCEVIYNRKMEVCTYCGTDLK